MYIIFRFFSIVVRTIMPRGLLLWWYIFFTGYTFEALIQKLFIARVECHSFTLYLNTFKLVGLGQMKKFLNSFPIFFLICFTRSCMKNNSLLKQKREKKIVICYILSTSYNLNSHVICISLIKILVYIIGFFSSILFPPFIFHLPSFLDHWSIMAVDSLLCWEVFC